VGADNALLISRSAEATGLQWTNAVTTKGDIFVYNGTDIDREGTAANDTILVADSTQPNGVKWGTVADVLPITTTGDLLGGTATGIGRLAVGTNHSVVSASSGETTGLKWDSVAFTHDIGDGTTNLMCGGPVAAPFTSILAAAANNIVVGTAALDAITTGENNIVIGNGCCATQTTASGNTVVGSSAATTLTGGSNVVVGYRAGQSYTSSSNNTAVGYESMATVTDGHSNTGVGWRADSTQTNGVGQLAMGFNSKTTGHYSVCLGYNAVTTATRQFMVGSTGITSITSWCPGVNNDTTLGSATFRFSELFSVNGTINTSDLRKKVVYDARPPGIEFISKLTPIQYKWKENDNGTHFGFGAQHIENLITDGVVPEWSGFVKTPLPNVEDDYSYGLRMTEFIAPIVQALQDVNNELQKTKVEVVELKKIVLKLCEKKM
jgi:hypothetical protein